jgi:hypothetical protein
VDSADVLVGSRHYARLVSLEFSRVNNEGAIDRAFDTREVHLHYLYSTSTSAPDWISLPAYRRFSTFEESQWRVLLSEWLQDCEENHPGCQRNDATLPTRLIDVGDDSEREPFLRISNGEKGCYAAFSHCWGAAPFLATKTDNLNQHQNIPYSTLPVNFKDAITACRAIGIQYLWIDSLCIVQDDISDWEVEASKMAAVYQGANVVLFASGAADSNSGLLNQERDEGCRTETTGSRELEAPYMNLDGTTCRIVARGFKWHATIPELYLQADVSSPLSRRAWALQEDLLASRRIFFTGEELLWKCRSSRKCQCMHMQSMNTRVQYTDESFATGWNDVNSEYVHMRHGGWRQLMGSYSKRQLTFESDRLPAISGLAKYIRDRGTGTGQYLSGMWKDDLWESLLWSAQRSIPCSEDQIIGTTYRKRASTYRAPTWSWMSLDAYAAGDEKPSCPEIKYPRCGELVHIDAKLKDAYCEPIGMDTTGALKSGYLILQSRCIEASVTWKDMASPIYHYGRPLPVDWDLDLPIGSKQSLLCVSIGQRKYGEFVGESLVLQRSISVEGAYERVGLLTQTKLQGINPRIYKDAKESIVRIV